MRYSTTQRIQRKDTGIVNALRVIFYETWFTCLRNLPHLYDVYIVNSPTMCTLRLNWNFDKPYFSPSDKATINLWLENYGNTYVYVSQIQIAFEFGVYQLPETICGTVQPPSIGFLGTVTLQLPDNRVGSQVFTIKYTAHKLLNQTWVRQHTFLTQRNLQREQLTATKMV